MGGAPDRVEEVEGARIRGGRRRIWPVEVPWRRSNLQGELEDWASMALALSSWGEGEMRRLERERKERRQGTVA